MTLKLCHLLPSLNPGGAENLLLDIVRKTNLGGVDHTVCFFEDDPYLQADFKKAGATVERIPPGLINVPFIDPIALARTVQYFRQNQFDIITSHVYVTHHIGRLGALLGGANKVVSVHHNTRDNYHPVIAGIEKYSRRLDSVTVAVSNGVKKSLQSLGNSHEWRMIYNGIDVKRFQEQVKEGHTAPIEERHRISHKFPVYLNVGRYSKQKSQDDLIKAFDKVTNSFNSPHLLLVGQRGNLEAELSTLVQERGLDEQVTITGRVDDVHPYYAVADAFVLSSVREGFGIVLLEAMAAGLPIVATDIPAVSEVLGEEVGKLVPPKAPDQLATAMSEIIKTRSTCSQANYEYALSNFDIEVTAASYLDLYKELMMEEDINDCCMPSDTTTV